jgi:hypothetical protein
MKHAECQGKMPKNPIAFFEKKGENARKSRAFLKMTLTRGKKTDKMKM